MPTNSAITSTTSITASTGPVLIGDDDGPTACQANTVGGSVALTSNAAGVELDTNAVTGDLTITVKTGNLPAPDSSPVDATGNSVTGQSTIQQ